MITSIKSTDIFVAIYYLHHDHLNWAVLTLSLVIVPSWVVSFFSLWWLIEDKDGERPSAFVILLHLFGLAPIWRYYHTLK